jgi:hypothetical protein
MTQHLEKVHEEHWIREENLDKMKNINPAVLIIWLLGNLSNKC